MQKYLLLVLWEFDFTKWIETVKYLSPILVISVDRICHGYILTGFKKQKELRGFRLLIHLPFNGICGFAEVETYRMIV